MALLASPIQSPPTGEQAWGSGLGRPKEPMLRDDQDPPRSSFEFVVYQMALLRSTTMQRRNEEDVVVLLQHVVAFSF
jgi:hypothetical protein